MEAFDKSTLTTVIFCAALMSAVDGSVDKEEWAVIKTFIKEHWMKEFGEFKPVQEQITKNIKTLMHNQVAMTKKLEQLTDILKRNLSQTQKKTLITLVKQVMMADQEISTNEEKLIHQLDRIMREDG